MKNLLHYTNCVYIVECNGLYKIGHTSHLESRLTGLQTSTPFPVSLVYVIPSLLNHRDTERALHLIFAESHVRGEWFKLSMRDIAKIKSLSMQEILAIAEKIRAERKIPDGQLAFDFVEDEEDS